MKHILLILFTITLFFATGLNAQHFTDFEFYDNAPTAIRQVMQHNANAVFRQIHEAHFNNRQTITLSSSNANSEAIEKTQTLWNAAKFYCIETDLMKPVSPMSNGRWQVRNIPVFFAGGATPEEQFLEIVLEYSSGGLISDLYIALPKHQYDNFFVNVSNETDLRRRHLILSFVENFRTAYYRRDIDFIRRVIGDDLSVGDDFQIIIKTYYTAFLEQSFNNNIYWNVNFSEIEVMQHAGNPNIYGVLLKKELKSSTITDKSWLFLMMDYRDENNPIIWVQTLQSDNVPKEKLMGLDNFRINR